MDTAIDHAIDPALAVLSLPAAAHWTSFEDDRLRVAAQAIDASSATAWEHVAEQVGTGKGTSQCEARWNELRMSEARSALAEGDQEKTSDDHQIASGTSNRMTDAQASTYLLESLRYNDDINVNSPARGSYAQLHQGHLGDSSRLPPLPDLPTLLAAAESATEHLSIMHTTASPAARIGTQYDDAEDVAKKHWRAEDDAKLLDLVEKYGPRNWGRLAKTLGTGRSGPSCCARWCRLAGANPQANAYVAPRQPNAPPLPHVTITKTTKSAYAAISKGKRSNWNRWTPTEDEQLANLVREHGTMRWAYIASLVPKQAETGHQRTVDSCHARWHHHLSKREEYKGWEEEAMARWAAEEAEEAEKAKEEEAVAAAAATLAGANPAEEEAMTGKRRRSKKTKKSPKKQLSKVELLKSVKARAQANAASSRWLPTDDAQLIKLKQDNPKEKWAWLGEQLEPKRSAGSCRARWAQQINKKATPLDESTSPPDAPEIPDLSPPPRDTADSIVVAGPSNPGAEAAAAIEAGLDVPVDPSLPAHSLPPIDAAPKSGPARRTQPWTTAEEIRLRELADLYNSTNWSQVAEDLGTGRTSMGVSARWRKLQHEDEKRANKKAAAMLSSNSAPAALNPIATQPPPFADITPLEIEEARQSLQIFLDGLVPTPPVAGDMPFGPSPHDATLDDNLTAEPYMAELMELREQPMLEGAEPVVEAVEQLAEIAQVVHATPQKGKKRAAVEGPAEMNTPSRRSQRLKT